MAEEKRVLNELTAVLCELSVAMAVANLITDKHYDLITIRLNILREIVDKMKDESTDRKTG